MTAPLSSTVPSKVDGLVRQRKWILPIGLLALVAATLWLLGSYHWPLPAIGQGSKRYVSLSPAITETLVALGVGGQLVGVSDYCHYPKSVEAVSHVGSGYTPRYDAILALGPTSVFVDAVSTVTTEPLGRIANVVPLPWLTLNDVIQSTRRLGHVTGCRAASEQLARAYESQLKSRVSPNSPRVLLTMAHIAGELQEVVFIRRNSIHGRVLEAAGARNAVSEDIVGVPRLSLEQVVQRNPDGIVILQSAPDADLRLIDDWRKLSVLRAVQTNQIRIIAAPEVAIPGPRILELVQRLAPIVSDWKSSP